MKRLNYYGNKYERVIRVKKHQGQDPVTRSILISILLGSFIFGSYQYAKDFNFENIRKAEAHEYISPLPTSVLAPSSTPAAQLSKYETPTVSGEISAVGVTKTPTPTAIPTPSELEEIVAYITRKFENEGKDEAERKATVIRAINCFYSESGLTEKKVGQNTDAPRSKDHGVAQLNDYWHKLTEEQKTEYKANIDKAYEIYKGWGDSFDPWYGRGCR